MIYEETSRGTEFQYTIQQYRPTHTKIHQNISISIYYSVLAMPEANLRERGSPRLTASNLVGFVRTVRPSVASVVIGEAKPRFAREITGDASSKEENQTIATGTPTPTTSTSQHF